MTFIPALEPLTTEQRGLGALYALRVYDSARVGVRHLAEALYHASKTNDKEAAWYVAAVARRSLQAMSLPAGNDLAKTEQWRRTAIAAAADRIVNGETDRPPITNISPWIEDMHDRDARASNG